MRSNYIMAVLCAGFGVVGVLTGGYEVDGVPWLILAVLWCLNLEEDRP